MTSTTSYRRGSEFRAFVQDSLAEQARRNPPKPKPLDRLRVKAETILSPGAAGRLAEAIRLRLAEERAFVTDTRARLAAILREWRAKPQAAPAVASDADWAEDSKDFVAPTRVAPPGAPARGVALPRPDGLLPAGEAALKRLQALTTARLRAFPDPMESDRGSRFLSRRVFASADLRFFTRTGIRFARKRSGPSVAATTAAPPQDAPSQDAPVLPKHKSAAGRALLRAMARRVDATRDSAIYLAAICLALLCGAGLLMQWPEAVPVVRTDAPAAPKPAWLDIAKPYQVYDLSAPQLAREKLVYTARRHSTGGGREDSLTYGEFASERIFMRLSAYRHGEEKADDAPFFVEMARRAAPLGLSIAQAQVEESQPTRFGEMQTARLNLTAGGVSRANCRGFRLSLPQPGLTLAGLACPGLQETMTANDLACLVNRLDLLAAGEDRPLRDFFGAAQARGAGACAQRRQ